MRPSVVFSKAAQTASALTKKESLAMAELPPPPPQAASATMDADTRLTILRWRFGKCTPAHRRCPGVLNSCDVSAAWCGGEGAEGLGRQPTVGDPRRHVGQAKIV